jgi:hypothetical protein
MAMHNRWATRSFKIAVIALVGVVVILFVYAPAYRQIDISQECCDKIKPGMTWTEFEAIIGAPPGDWRSANRLGPASMLVFEDKPFKLWWKGDAREITVLIDQHAGVIESHFEPAADTSP